MQNKSASEVAPDNSKIAVTLLDRLTPHPRVFLRGCELWDFWSDFMEMNWSRWFRCESSFGLLLVPNQPGIFALAEEIVQPAGPNSRRMLAVIEVGEADDLVRALSRLYTASSPWRQQLAEARCYLRYAVIPDAEERRSAAGALKNWLSSQREVAAQLFERPVTVPSEPRATIPSVHVLPEVPEVEAAEMKTVAERAVDRVTRRTNLARTSPPGL